jgi:hypothetical protein
MKLAILISLMSCLNVYGNELCEKQTDYSSEIKMKYTSVIIKDSGAVIFCGNSRTDIARPMSRILSLVEGECKNTVIDGQSFYITCGK